MWKSRFTRLGKAALPQRAVVRQAAEESIKLAKIGAGCDREKVEAMKPVEPEVITIAQLEIRYLMDGVATGAASGMFELTVPPGAWVPPPHSHSKNEEIIYCLEGTLRCSVDGELRDTKSRVSGNEYAARRRAWLQQSA